MTHGGRGYIFRAVTIHQVQVTQTSARSVSYHSMLKRDNNTGVTIYGIVYLGVLGFETNSVCT